MRLPRRRTTRRLGELARLLTELDRASSDGRFRRRQAEPYRLSLGR